ncbi:MAG: 50S ribosomal protein L11 methyltransferase, partial [Muribaculaceae bacterium]|nr:50S ribosomal protein L11 methyltransferase [Muribaculaceae bacterium]
ALLCDAGYESFEPDERGLTAYIKEPEFDSLSLRNLIESFPLEGFRIECHASTVEGQDWNSEWEKNYFKPIVVGDRCVIHSSFHTDYPQCEHEIVIDPKMAFGTGHHATTSLIIERLLSMPLGGKSVVDMGTGTGILAILAAMLGASPVTAIEIDPAAEANARENVASNGHPEIQVMLGDAALLDGLHADLFIANINRNIITADLPSYAATLAVGGVMLLSGFYESDIPVVMQAAAPLGLTELTHTVKGDGWTCLVLTKNH